MNRPEALKRQTLGAPVRTVAGFFIGAILGLLSFGLAWVSWWPQSLDAFINITALLGVIVLITAAACSAMFSVRPIRRRWVVFLGIALGGLGGVLASHWYLLAVAVDCLRGSGPQEAWCREGFSRLPLLAASSLAGAWIGFVATVLGISPLRTAAN